MAPAVLVRPTYAEVGKTGDPPRIAECRIGFDGHFKVGHWTPVWVGVAGDVAGRPLRVTATTIDSDGVQVNVSAPLDSSGQTADGVWPVLLYTKVGRIDAPVQVTLLADDHTVLSRLSLSPREGSETGRQFLVMPATSQLVVQLGASSVGLAEAYAKRVEGNEVTRAVARVLDVDALPTDWFGYEAAELLVLTTKDAGLVRKLAADAPRLRALRQWLELGGRLVILAGGDEMAELMGERAPLAGLLPGKFTEVVRLPETGSLEHYAGSEVPLVAGGMRTAIMVPQLVGAEGNIEVYAGRRPTDLPLVVRTARGLGEVAFVGVDLSAPPFSEWPGRKTFLQAVLRPYVSQREADVTAQSLVVRGYDDLSGALRQRLGQSFAGVAPITFSLVTVLAIAYLLVLGPLDYLLVHRWLRRPWVAWVSFPLVVLAFGVAAIALGDWRMAGGGPRVNRLELVDVDLASGRARGSFWAMLYSPRAAQFNLTLDVDWLGGQSQADPQKLLSWWGLPGVGIGGMQSGGADLGMVRDGYRFGPGLASLLDMPVLTSSTKSLQACWTAPAENIIDAQLVDRDGLAEGYLANHTELPLRNLRLLYNGWAYRLGNLEPGQRVDVGDEISPRRVKTIVTRDALGPTNPGDVDRKVFVAQRATAEQILSLMMFYEAAGGFDFAQLTNDYQACFDLSRLLDLGRAILVAETPARGSRLVVAASGEPIEDEPETAAVLYRFVLPVAKTHNDQ